MLTTPHCKKYLVTKCSYRKPRTSTDTLVQTKQRRRDMRFGTWKVRSPHKAGLLDLQEVGCIDKDWNELA
jgi:hypothetical protein